MTDTNREPENQDPDDMKIRESIESVTVYNPMTEEMECIPVGYSVDASGYALRFRGVELPAGTDPWAHAVEREKARRARTAAEFDALSRLIRAMFSEMRTVTGLKLSGTGLKPPGDDLGVTEEPKL